MTTATTFRAALGVAALCIVLALLAFLNHFAHFIESSNPHPLFGAKLGIFFVLLALACGIWANYNRPNPSA